MTSRHPSACADVQAKASPAQAKILAKLAAGARLSLDPKSGRYAITEVGGAVTSVDQRPVATMLRNGLLHQDLMGYCRIAPSSSHGFPLADRA